MTIKERIGWKLLSWRKSDAGDRRVSLPRVTENANSACIVLPVSFDDFDLVRTILPDILVRLSHARVTIWVRENFRSWLVIDEYCNVRNYDPARATRFGIPSQDMTKQIRSAEYDLMIDLSLNPDLYVAGLAKEVRATTKVGLSHPHTQSLYNLLVESSSPDSGRRIMTLLNYL